MPNNYKLPLYDELFLLGSSSRAKSRLNVKGAAYQNFFTSLTKRNTGAVGELLSGFGAKVNPAYIHVPLETAINAPLATGTKRGGSY